MCGNTNLKDPTQYSLFMSNVISTGCKKPIRVLYAIDVSRGLGEGLDRSKRWNRLKSFISTLTKSVIPGVKHSFMVYNIEARFLNHLDGCDRATEFFTTADDCLCKKRMTEPTAGCSVNAPAPGESMEDWGKTGPRTGNALQTARKMYFEPDLDGYKNIIFLITHKESTDDMLLPENDLKRVGINLIDIELAERRDLRKKSNIPQNRKINTSSIHGRNLENNRVHTAMNHNVNLHKNHLPYNTESSKRKVKRKTLENIHARSKFLFLNGMIFHKPVNNIKRDYKNYTDFHKNLLLFKNKTLKNPFYLSWKQYYHHSRNSGHIFKRHHFHRRRNRHEKYYLRVKRGNADDGIPDEHKIKISLKKLQSTLRSIVAKVCITDTGDERRKKSHVLKDKSNNHPT